MAKKTTKKTITLELSPAVLDELTTIVNHLGISSPEALFKNYIREVLLAGRTEVVTAEARQHVLKTSGDLDSLKLPDQKT